MTQQHSQIFLTSGESCRHATFPSCVPTKLVGQWNRNTQKQGLSLFYGNGNNMYYHYGSLQSKWDLCSSEWKLIDDLALKPHCCCEYWGEWHTWSYSPHDSHRTEAALEVNERSARNFMTISYFCLCVWAPHTLLNSYALSDTKCRLIRR